MRTDQGSHRGSSPLCNISPALCDTHSLFPLPSGFTISLALSLRPRAIALALSAVERSRASLKAPGILPRRSVN
jgi:hypothetical protein